MVLPDGRVIRFLRGTAGGADATDEWLVSGLHKIQALIGGSELGAAPATVNFVLNAEGTAATEDANPGALAVEAAGANVITATVIGYPDDKLKR